jgi:hypothetical protein
MITVRFGLLTKRELSEDPRDLLARLLSHRAMSFGHDRQMFVAGYHAIPWHCEDAPGVAFTAREALGVPGRNGILFIFRGLLSTPVVARFELAACKLPRARPRNDVAYRQGVEEKRVSARKYPSQGDVLRACHRCYRAPCTVSEG